MFGFSKSSPALYSGSLSPEELPGVKKKSFPLYFGGGEIWFEHLDGMYQFSGLVLEKLRGDSKTFLKPSGPSAIGFVLNETIVTDEISQEIARLLCSGKKVFTRVCFIGADKDTKRRLTALLKYRKRFAVNFIYDFEKAKEWLVSEEM
ncbi:MAG: hypothetical protein ACI4XA_04150 [Oscillospiraceae bacterium]